MNNYKLAVIGVGNMAKAIIDGIQKNDTTVDEIRLFDTNPAQYNSLISGKCPYVFCKALSEAVEAADCVLLSVKPQILPTVLKDIAQIKNSEYKLYITIAAGIEAKYVSDSLNGADVVRVLPNLPMTIGKGVSVICKNPLLSSDKFLFVCSLFSSSGSNLLIDESEMNRMIGVTSSSPAYVFKFIDAMYKSALAQGLDAEGLVDAICDVFIGSAALLKQSGASPAALMERVASKGGTTERALASLDADNIDKIISAAMTECTKRADELGEKK